MGFSYTLLALSKAYTPEEIDTFTDDLGANQLRATYEAEFDDVMSISFGGATEFGLCTLDQASLLFCNQMEGLMQGFDLKRASERIGKAALITVEEHSMVMLATYYQDGLLMREFIDNNGEKVTDETHESYAIPKGSDAMNECTAIIQAIVGQSFYTIDSDHPVMQFKWASGI